MGLPLTSSGLSREVFTSTRDGELASVTAAVPSA